MSPALRRRSVDGPSDAFDASEPVDTVDAAPGGRPAPVVAVCAVVVLAGLACLVAATVPVGPSWLGEAGAVAVASTYAWALAARTGGRPAVFGLLALALGVGVVVEGSAGLRTGAAVLACVTSAVLAVMVTVPATGYWRAVREAVVAVVVAVVGALATIGFEPTLTVTRFEYATFGLSLVAAFAVVHRLGAGLHGLGRRGLVIVVVGGAVLAVTLLYAELLRRYGTAELVVDLLDLVRWCRDHLGAFPRPVVAVLGVPALVYGVHMRARRRQGWWVCAFGAAATSAVGNSLANPAISHVESALSVAYGTLVGLVLGWALIRVDLLVTGSDAGSGSRGRRSRRVEQTAALRPEPSRFRPLL